MIAGRKAQRLVDVSFGLSASTDKVFRVPDETMGPSQVSIQSQCVLALSNGLSRTLRKHLHEAQQHVSHSVVPASDNALVKIASAEVNRTDQSSVARIPAADTSTA